MFTSTRCTYVRITSCHRVQKNCPIQSLLQELSASAELVSSAEVALGSQLQCVECDARAETFFTVVVPDEVSETDKKLLLQTVSNAERFGTAARASLCLQVKCRRSLKARLNYKRTPENRDRLLTVCHNCRLLRVKVYRCSRCRRTAYCGKRCQRLHWSTHKSDCNKYKNPNQQETTTR